jgi:hypothetical protein
MVETGTIQQPGKLDRIMISQMKAVQRTRLYADKLASDYLIKQLDTETTGGRLELSSTCEIYSHHSIICLAR